MRRRSRMIYVFDRCCRPAPGCNLWQYSCGTAAPLCELVSQASMFVSKDRTTTMLPSTMKPKLLCALLILIFVSRVHAQTTPAPKPLDLLKHRLETISQETADKRFGTGVLRTLDEGVNLSFHDALMMMIIQSDNTGTDMAFARAGGPAHVTQTMHTMGLNSMVATGTTFDWFHALTAAGDPAYAKYTPEELFTKGFPEKLTDAEVEKFHFDGKHPFGLSSARDMGKLLEMMANNKAASEKSCKEMLHMMGLQQMRTRIPKFIEDDANTPHKTGDFPPYIANDVGLIETPAGRVVVVFFNAHHRGFYSELEDADARMSEQVWAYFNYRGKTEGK